MLRLRLHGLLRMSMLCSALAITPSTHSATPAAGTSICQTPQLLVLVFPPCHRQCQTILTPRQMNAEWRAESPETYLKPIFSRFVLNSLQA